MTALRMKSLNEFITLQRGFDLPAGHRKEGAYLVVASTGIVGYHNEPKVEGPGVVIGRSGSIGGGQYIEDDFWPLNTTLWVKDFKGNNPRFTYYLLRSIDFTRFNAGAGVPTLNRNHIASLIIRDFVKSQQDHIARVLSTYDDLIENNRRRIHLLEQAARLLYQEWFVHLRFPGHEHTPIIDGVPEGWEKKQLGDVAATNAESYKANNLPNEINYIDISSVKQGRILSKSKMPSLEAPGRARRKGADGDVIWSNVRPNLRAYALVLEPDDNDVFSTGFTILSPAAIPFSYLYLFATADEFVGHLINHTTGASYPAVRPADFERAEILLPAQSVLKIFHEKMEPAFRMIQILEKEITALAKARDLLLPKMMNGEVVA